MCPGTAIRLTPLSVGLFKELSEDECMIIYEPISIDPQKMT
jgi:hypothetical protein